MTISNYVKPITQTEADIFERVALLMIGQVKNNRTTKSNTIYPRRPSRFPKCSVLRAISVTSDLWVKLRGSPQTIV